MIVYLRSTRVDGHCMIGRKRRAMNTDSRSLKKQVMEEEEELLAWGIGVVCLAYWLMLLLKLFIIVFVLPEELAVVAPFMLLPFPFLVGAGVGEVELLLVLLAVGLLDAVVLVCGSVACIWTIIQPDITTSRTT